MKPYTQEGLYMDIIIIEYLEMKIITFAFKQISPKP